MDKVVTNVGQAHKHGLVCHSVMLESTGLAMHYTTFTIGIMHSLKLNFAEKNGVHLKKPTLSIGWTWIEEEDAFISITPKIVTGFF